jgi:hypothetical protein
VFLFWGQILQVFNLKNKISTARKKFVEKMTLIHHISKKKKLELPDIYNKFHQVAETPDIGWFSPISELTGQCIF